PSSPELCATGSPSVVFPLAPPPEPYTLSLHDALPILVDAEGGSVPPPPDVHLLAADIEQLRRAKCVVAVAGGQHKIDAIHAALRDRKSTRLNSSHVKISYAVFCLKQKKQPARAWSAVD